MNTRYYRNDGIEAAPLNEEAILLEPVTANFYLLNRTSSFLWERLVEPRTAEVLASEVCKAFLDIAPGEALRDVQSALEDMVSKKLVFVDASN